MEGKITLNQNQSNCIQREYNITGTTYHNVCGGGSHTVPFGALDYMAIAITAAFLIAVITTIIIGMYKLITE